MVYLYWHANYIIVIEKENSSSTYKHLGKKSFKNLNLLNTLIFFEIKVNLTPIILRRKGIDQFTQKGNNTHEVLIKQNNTF